MTDLVFYGGLSGANLGNQQFTSRNMKFYNAVSAVTQTYDWGMSIPFSDTVAFITRNV